MLLAALLVQTLASCTGLTVTATNSGPTCDGAPVTLTATTNAANPSFHWQCLKCGGPAPGVNYDVQTLTVNNYGVMWEVIVTDNATGCTASAMTTPQRDPRPLISAPLSWCAGNGDIAVKIGNDDPGNPYTNITWSVRNGVITSGQGTKTITVHPNSQYPNDVDVAYDIAATNTHGCSFPQTGYFDTSTNVAPEQPLFDLQAPSSACGSQAFEATIVPTTAIYTLGWSATNATLVFCQKPYTTQCFQPSGPGPATVSAIYTTQAAPGCPRTASRTVMIRPGPSAAIDAAVITTCAGEDVVIPVALSGTPPFTVRWSDGMVQDGIGGNAVTRTVQPQTDTDYAIVSVSDANCAGMANHGVSVHVAENPAILAGPRSAVVAPNTSATLTVQASSPNVLFRWYEGQSGDTGHPVGTLTNTLTTPPITKTASYWVRVSNACGFADSAAATVMPSTALRRRPAGH